MASCYPLATDHEQTSNVTFVAHTAMNHSEQITDESNSNETPYLSNTDDDILIDDYYAYFKEKFSRLKLQFPVDFEKNANVLWNIDTATSLYIGYLPPILRLNVLNRSNNVFLVISDLLGSYDNSSSGDHDNKMKSFYEIVGRFNIGSVIKLDDIYYTKDYQRSFIS